MTNKRDAANSPLHRIFEKNQRKVVKTQRVGKVLTQMADEQHILIAQLIAKWLTDDEKKKGNKKR